MDSTRTVADFKIEMARFGLSAAEFLRKLNRGAEFLLNSDIFTRLFSVYETKAVNGYVTMPAGYGRAMAVQIGDYPAGAFNNWVQFIHCGMGRLTPDRIGILGIVCEGDDFCTQTEIRDATTHQPVEAVLQIKCALADVGNTIRFNGTYTDTNGLEQIILNPSADGSQGLPVELTGVTTTTTQTFKRLTDIQVVGEFAMGNRWTLSKVISGTPQQIGQYEPNENRPKYIRYLAGESCETLRIYSRRLHVPLIYDTDWVRPDNVTVMEMLFTAQTLGDKPSVSAANNLWEQAKKILRAEYASKYPEPDIYLTSDPDGPPPVNPMGPGGRRYW